MKIAVMILSILNIRLLLNICNFEQGVAISWWGRPTHPIFSLLAHLPVINSTRQCCIADKIGKSPLCRQTWPERSLFVGKLELCTPPTMFFSFGPNCETKQTTIKLQGLLETVTNLLFPAC